MEGDVRFGLLLEKAEPHPTASLIDIKEAQQSGETLPEARVLHPAGVRLFRKALGIDLQKVALSEPEVLRLASEVFPVEEPTAEKGAQSGFDPRQRLQLIATLGYQEAAKRLDRAEASLYIWVRRCVPKPYETPKARKPASAQALAPSVERRPRSDITRNPRPVGAVSLAHWLLLIDEGDDSANILAWQDRALCPQTDPDAFFPERGGSTQEAKRVCLQCEVRTECLDYALKNDERFGVWGGLSERERRRLKKRAI